jgi:hypothetical protein
MDETVQTMKNTGQSLPTEIEQLVEGIDFEKQYFGLEILTRVLIKDRSVSLWWN